MAGGARGGDGGAARLRTGHQRGTARPDRRVGRGAEAGNSGVLARIEVHDADPQVPQPRTPDRLEGSGFGFVLIEALADNWGVRAATIGKAVWAELDMRRDAGPEA